MAPAEVEQLRVLSRAAFGQAYRLEVMLAVADSGDGLVSLTDLARALDQSPSNIQGPLRSLVSVGLLSDVPSGDSKRKYYIRNPSAAWDWAREMRQLATALAGVRRETHATSRNGIGSRSGG